MSVHLDVQRLYSILVDNHCSTGHISDFTCLSSNETSKSGRNQYFVPYCPLTVTLSFLSSLVALSLSLFSSIQYIPSFFNVLHSSVTRESTVQKEIKIIYKTYKANQTQGWTLWQVARATAHTSTGIIDNYGRDTEKWNSAILV